ncbi:MAG: hypothetical protein R3B90_23655 [Planctomycetaceae bacterium]
MDSLLDQTGLARGQAASAENGAQVLRGSLRPRRIGASIPVTRLPHVGTGGLAQQTRVPFSN